MMNNEEFPGDEVTLHCPKCPRRLITRRRPEQVYWRVTDWVWSMATYRCDGCGYEHRFTAEWLLDHAGVVNKADFSGGLDTPLAP